MKKISCASFLFIAPLHARIKNSCDQTRFYDSVEKSCYDFSSVIVRYY